MITKLKKTGNAWGLTIPKAVIDLFKLQAGNEFEVITENDQLVIRAVSERKKMFDKNHQAIIDQNDELFTRLADK